MRIPLGSVIGQGVLWKVCPLLALQKRFKKIGTFRKEGHQMKVTTRAESPSPFC